MTDGYVSPSEAFAALGDETRVAIVETLGDADGSLTFSELRTRVGAQDSGRFNYHLSKLVGTFVRRTDDGYELTYAGTRVVGAILAGTYNRRGSIGTFELDSACRECGNAVEATYDDERVTIRCPTCDEQLSAFGFPPGGLEGRDRADLERTFGRWLVDVVSLVADGICWNCAGVTRGRLVDDIDAFGASTIGVRTDCERCGETVTMQVNAYLLTRPVVVAFYDEHGIETTETPPWNLPCQRHEEQLAVESTDPLRVRSTFALEDDRLEIALEADLTIAEIERSHDE